MSPRSHTDCVNDPDDESVHRHHHRRNGTGRSDRLCCATWNEHDPGDRIDHRWDTNAPGHGVAFGIPDARATAAVAVVVSKETATAMSSSFLSFTGAWRQRRRRRHRRGWVLPVTTTLPLLVFLDMLAVSLVVPLLFQYYKSAGVTSAAERELLSSVYSMAQIVGGLGFGVLADADRVHRRTILLISYLGSLISYSMLMIPPGSSSGGGSSNSGFVTVVASRILVGLAKQSTTVTVSVVTAATDAETRAKHLGRLSSASTAAWIVGPTIGSLLYKYVGPGLPCFVACCLFGVNAALSFALLTDEQMKGKIAPPPPRGGVLELISTTPNQEKQQQQQQQQQQAVSKPRFTVWSNLQTCFSSPELGAVVVVSLIVTWVTRATNYSQLGSFYEDMYGLEPHHRGYIYSYQQALQFVVQSVLVERILRVFVSERRTICFFTALLALAVGLEAQRSLPMFLTILCPLISVSFAITNVTLQSLVTRVAPAQAIFSALAALDVLQNAVSVTVPFYRTALFQLLQPTSNSGSSSGDPSPVSWVLACAAHWTVAALCISVLLLSKRFTTAAETNQKHK